MPCSHARGASQSIDGRASASWRCLPSVVDALNAHLAVIADPGPDGLAFPAPEAGLLRLENFRKRVWQPAVAAAGIAPLRVHDLRHMCASLATAAGADVKVLQRMLGHASAALTLDRYGHLLPGEAQSVADWLDEKLGQRPRRRVLRCLSCSDRGIFAGSNGAALADLTEVTTVTRTFAVVGTGVDPVTSRFSGARSAN